MLDDMPDKPPASIAILGDDPTLNLSLSLVGEDYATPVSINQEPSSRFEKTDWFLAPETWVIVHDGDAAAAEAITRAQMKEYLGLAHSWIERWCDTGSNPFIHHRLYSSTFPECVQVAYATLASYINRTPANTDIVLRIVEDRATALLHDNGAVVDKFIANEWACQEDEDDIDLLHQLARVHALLIYQMIGLFDGDTRSRYVAEGRLGVQVGWASKLYRAAASQLSTGQYTTQHSFGPIPTNAAQSRWYLWILTESIRRTWLVTLSMSCVFSALQQRWSACPGGIMFTTRSGLWEATTAASWQRQCLDKDPAFLQRFESATLFSTAKLEDVDEFGIAMLDMTFGREAVEQWKIDCNRSG